MGLLDDMTTWVGEAPPQPLSSQRFGNLAFREYIRLVNEVSIGEFVLRTERLTISGYRTS